MTSEAQHIAALLIRHWQGEIAPEEASELQAWAGDDMQRKHLLESFHSPDQAAQWLAKWRAHDKSTIAARLQREFPALQLSNNVAGERVGQRPVHRVHFLKTAWVRYAAAIIILFGIGAYLWNTQQKKNQYTKTSKPSSSKNDILPGGQKAVLTLADGSTIVLDSAANGQLATQKGAEVIKLADGQLSYKTTGTIRDEAVTYNTMTTPNGGQYQLRLPDGTQVWLNAASSITYPVAFTGTNRKVTVTGEVYFEVISDKAKPFLVDINGRSTVQVLGTRFNVNAYDDEPNIKTTLVEGSIKIGSGADSRIIVPGQQAIVGEGIRINPVKVENVVAWKNGYFNFEGASLQEFMRQLARWYDLIIIYKGKPGNQTFKGKLGRDLLLSEVLETLQFFHIRYSINGRTLTIEEA